MVSSRQVLHVPRTSRCIVHGRDEPVEPSAFIVCPTCGHVYMTAAELVTAYNRWVVWLNTDQRLAFLPGVEFKAVGDADTIDYCQECVHDF